jgi:hypothetical protein
MRSTILICAVVLLAGGAAGLDQGDNAMGMFFGPDEYSDVGRWRDAYALGEPFPAYVVLVNCTVELVGGYEVGITIPDDQVLVIEATGPNGWTNFGDNTNHLVGFMTPVPEVDGSVLLCTLTLVCNTPSAVPINYGPADPPSIDLVPVIADGADPNILVPCDLFGGANPVAGLNWEVAVNPRSLSGIKALFD